MPNQPSARDLLDMSVPISRFNKGEAAKILDEVNTSGIKVVMKNNKPAGVLLSLHKYLEVMEIVESYHLLLESIARLEVTAVDEPLAHEEDTALLNVAVSKSKRTYTLDEVKRALGLK